MHTEPYETVTSPPLPRVNKTPQRTQTAPPASHRPLQSEEAQQQDFPEAVSAVQRTPKVKKSQSSKHPRGQSSATGAEELNPSDLNHEIPAAADSPVKQSERLPRGDTQARTGRDAERNVGVEVIGITEQDLEDPYDTDVTYHGPQPTEQDLPPNDPPTRSEVAKGKRREVNEQNHDDARPKGPSQIPDTEKLNFHLQESPPGFGIQCGPLAQSKVVDKVGCAKSMVSTYL